MQRSDLTDARICELLGGVEVTREDRHLIRIGYAEAMRAQWVPCSERMPKRRDGSLFTHEVWVYRHRIGRVEQAFHDGESWWVGDMFDTIGDVTHWMPLHKPEPPAAPKEPTP